MPTVFSIYIIHVNPLIWKNVIYERFIRIATFGGIELFFAIVFIATAIFIVCSCIDQIRVVIFKAIGLKNKIKAIDRWLS